MSAIIAAGATAGAGVALLAWWAAPANPELASALDRLDPERRTTRSGPVQVSGPEPLDRLGIWVQRHLPTRWAKVPTADLNVLQISPATHLGKKTTVAFAGLVFPALLTALALACGLTLPVTVPALLGPVTALGMWIVPDIDARRAAAAARDEFSRAVAAYLDLVALERAAGGGSSQALEAAAEVGDSWVFRRVREEVARARFSGDPTWDALARLGDELGVPALIDVGDLMRMGAEEGMPVIEPLRARAASLRDQHLADDHAKANAANEALAMPVALLGIVFLALLTIPALLKIAFGL